MFMLFILYVLQLSSTKGVSNQMPPRQLELSLRKVNTLLANLDDEISVERELLTQIDETDGGAAYLKTNLNFNGPAIPQSEPEIGIEESNVWDPAYPYSNKKRIKWRLRQLPTNLIPDLPDLGQEWPFEDPIIPASSAPTARRPVALPVRRPVSPTVRRPVSIAEKRPVALTVKGPSAQTVKRPLPLTARPPPPRPSAMAAETAKQPTTVVRRPASIPTHLIRHPLRKSMVSFMRSEKVKYVCAFTKGMSEILLKKTDACLRLLIDTCGATLSKMVDENKLRCVGELLESRLKYTGSVAHTLSSVHFKYLALRALESVDHQIEIYSKPLRLIKDYEKYFHPDEGNNLLNVVIPVDNYDSKIHGQPLASALCTRVIEVLSAPLNRMCGTPELESILNKANDVYSEIFPSSRRLSKNYTFTEFSNSFGNNLTSEPQFRRSMSNYKHIKSEYKKMLRHYILKHPTLFKTFAKHYRQSEERKHRRIKHNHHHRSHHSHHHKRHHHKHKHHNEKKSKNVANNTNYNTTTLTTIKETPIYFNSTLFRTMNVQKRYDIVEVSPKPIKRIIPSILSRRDNNNNYESVGHIKEKVMNTYSEPKQSDYVRRIPYNNTILEKVLGDSSYSDDELYLKTMIKDAYFHGEMNIPSRALNNKKMKSFT